MMQTKLWLERFRGSFVLALPLVALVLIVA